MSINAKKGLGFLVSFMVCFAVATIGGLINGPQILTWHAGLHRPDWDPPTYIFGPIWTVLYIMMAISAGMIWCEHDTRPVVLPLLAFVAQLLLNLGWTLLFFGAHEIGTAAWEIILLDLAVLTTIVLFWRLSQFAALLLFPYFAWLLYATAISWEIWRLNS